MITKLQIPPTSPSQAISNLSYRESYSSTLAISSSTPATLKLFTERTIQANKSVKLYIYIPVRKFSSGANVIYIGTNIKINGTWFSLGTSGSANNLSVQNDRCIGSYTNTKVLYIDNLIRDCGVVADSTYTIQVELTVSCNSGNFTINGEHAMNFANKGQRGAEIAHGTYQNYTTLIIQELS